MSEQGQAATQPAMQPVEDVAMDIAKGILEQEEGAEQPRDEKGKFTKAEEKPEEKAEEVVEEQEEQESEEEPQPEVRKHKFKVRSEEGEVEVEEDDEGLKKGYMLERDYRVKTAKLARERETIQIKVREQVEPKLKEYEEKLSLAEQAIWHTLAPEIQNTDWNKLAEENPAEWAKRYQHVQNVNAKLAQIQGERKKVAEAQQEEMKSKLRKHAEESVEILKSEIPNWSNDLYGEILKDAVKLYGFKAEEVNAITDHRAIKVLHDARQYQALKAKPIVDKRSVPNAPKVVKPGAGEKPEASAEKWKEGMAKLDKSGRKEDAYDLARLMLAAEGKRK